MTDAPVPIEDDYEDDEAPVNAEPIPGEEAPVEEPAEEEKGSKVSSALPDSVAAAVRTAVPMIVGFIVAMLARVGLHVPDTVKDQLTMGLPPVLAYLYWLIAHQLEKKFPKVPWLGSTKKPLYTTPGVTAFSASQLVTYKGKRFSPTVRDSLVELDRLTPHIPVVFAQGGWNAGGVTASAGTHDQDAVDVSVNGLSVDQIRTLVVTLRMLGWAAWYRPYNWDRRGGGAHIHAVPNGWGCLSSGAKDQVEQYRNGTNGLASYGPDNQLGCTSAYRQRTWQGYLATKSTTHVKAATTTAKRAAIPISFSRYQQGVQTGQPNGNVKIVQELLARQKKTHGGSGYYPGKPDGIAGPMTRQAIKDWQIAIGDAGDGVLGPKQFAKLVAWGGYVSVK